MSILLSLATALSNDSLTLFVGTGFSRHLTNNSAPSWNELMAECAKTIDPTNSLYVQLFQESDNGSIQTKFPILICAQVLELRFKQEKRNFKEEIARIVKERINRRTINEDHLEEAKNFFKRYKNINIVTTNYDDLFSSYIIPKAKVIVEGSPIPRFNKGQNIFHIHGFVKKPESIVASYNDYYQFINSRNYFSRKFFTLLQETTVVIIGYSLDDFNLNAILNEVNATRKESFRSTDIAYISRSDVDPIIKEFYYNTYGIKTTRISNLSSFFIGIERNSSRAKELTKSVRQLKTMMKGRKFYEDDFLRLRSSLHDILQQADLLDIEKTDSAFLNLLIKVFKRKKQFSRADSAWEQYHHLADWLIEVASRIAVRGSEIEDEYCELVKYSFRHCSRKRYMGYSWQAYKEWNTRWKEMRHQNQSMLRELIQANLFDRDLDIDKIFVEGYSEEV